MRATLSLLRTMTKSPVSTLGVKVGLFLPRRIDATLDASLPSGTPAASTTYHFLSTVSALAI